MPRLPTGVPGFDAMVQGGLPVGSSVVLQGPPGQEKLRFALTFLAEGLKSGGSGLVVTSSQSPDAVIAELRALGVNLDSVTNENRLRVVDWYSWSEETVQDIEERGIVIRSSIDLTNLGVALSRAIAALTGGESRRAVIELLSPATSSYEVTQVYAFAQGAKRKFDRHRFTSLVLLEKEMHSGEQLTTLHQPFDGVIEIERTRSGDRIVRKIGVLHLKDTASDPNFRFLEVSEAGMRVVQDAVKPATAGSSGRGSVLESQDERAQRLRLILQIATERLKLNPGDADALFAMAAAQATLDDAKGGLETLDRLADLDSAYPGLWVLKTKLHAKLGQSELAQQSRLRALQREPEAAKAIDATVPCPMCEAPIALDATSCANCGVKFTQTRTLEDELDDLGHAAIQEIVQEDLGAAKEAEKVPTETAARAPKPKSERPSPPPGKPAEKAPSKKGLTNGLVLERRGGPKAGRTNGLGGRTNGLRGRTNGLTNGLGRSNGLARTTGLTNGLGRTNGLTNGLGRTNGLTNGLGRTNGITNGLGRTNGLTNGLGGIRSAGFHRSSRGGIARTAGWKLYLIPIVAVSLLLVPLFLVPEYFGPSYPIQIDGQFNDWAAVATEAMSAGTVPNPNVDVVRFGIVNNLGPVAFYVEVAGGALVGGGAPPGTMDTVRIFVDIDGSTATGYRIDGLGADRMIEVSGYGGSVRSSTLWEFDSNRDQRDWNGWIKGTVTPAAASGSRIEAEAQWLPGVSATGPVIATVHTLSWDGQTDVGDFPISPGIGTLSVTADPQVPDIITGNGVSLIRLTLTAHGQPVSLSSLEAQIVGTAPPTSAQSLRLTDGVNGISQVTPASRDVSFAFSPMQIGVGATTTLFVVGDFASTSGETFGLRPPPTHPFGVSSAVVALQENSGARTLGYLGTIPSTPHVDGAFDEWTSLSSDAAGDVMPRANPSIDLGRYGAQRSGASTFLYTDVSGRIMRGTPVPELPRAAPAQGSQGPADTDRDGVPDLVDPFPLDFNNDGIPDAQTNCDVDGDGIVDYGCPGGMDYWLNTTIPNTFPAPYAGRLVSLYIGPTNRPAVLGEDALRIFLDTDNSTFSGYSIGGIGADRLVEIRGKDGVVTQSALLAFAGSFPGEWSWTPLAPVTVALGYHGVELSVPLNATHLYLEAGDFWGSVDSVSVVPAFAVQASSFKLSSSNTPLAVPWQQVSPQPTGTLIDPGSNAPTTTYNHQRKVVRAGDVPVDTACDATNSDGCWYAVFYDQFKEPTSAFKDGASVAVPTTMASIDNIATTLPAGDNLVIIGVTLDSTSDLVMDIVAGNLELRRGAAILADNQFTIGVRDINPTTNTRYPTNMIWLLFKDVGATANPQYDIFAAASVAGMNAEVKFLIIQGGSSSFQDGGSVAIGTAETTVLSHASTVPAGDNVILVAFQPDDTTTSTRDILAGNIRLKRGATVLSSNEFAVNLMEAARAHSSKGVLLIARDAGAPASPTYDVTSLASATGVNGEAKIIVLNGLSSAFLDTPSVAVGTSETVIGSLATTFAAGTNVILGSGMFDNTAGSQVNILSGNHGLVKGTTQSSNQFGYRLGQTSFTDSNEISAGLMWMDVESAANPTYDIRALASATGINGETKLLAIHTPAVLWDRIILMRSSDTSGSAWGSQIILASGRSGDSPLLLARDSSEPSIAIDSGGFLHIVWVSASAAGDQSALNLVRYTKTTVAYPTQSELASAGNWEAVTNVDDASPGFMPTVSTSKRRVTVQNNVATIPTNTASVDVTITSVDTARAFLMFGTQVNSNEPGKGQTSGRLVDATTLRFERGIATAPAPAITIEWYVVEFLNGVTVQRGSTTLGTLPADIGISSVDTSKAVPIVSLRTNGVDYDTNDFLRAKITTSTNLQLNMDAACAPCTAEWQVVEFAAATVQTGDISWAAGDATRTATVTTVDTAKSWLLFSYQSAAGTIANIGQKMVRGVVTNPTTLTFDRNNTGQTMTLTWSLITFTDETKVQSGTAWFSASESQKDVTIASVDTSKAIAAAGAIHYRGGSTPYSADDNPGTGTVTLDFTSSTNLRLTRALTGSTTAGVGWFVIQFSESGEPHIAWSGSKTSGTVYYKNKAASTWRATVSWGTTYTGLSVDVSPQNDYVSLARFFDAVTDEIQYTVCKNLATSNCDAAAEFTKWDGTAGADTVVTAPEVASYPSLAHTYEANGDVWVAYAKDVDGSTRAIYARLLDYPSSGWQTAETVDSLTNTVFTKPSIGIDGNNGVHALYVATSGPQVYYNKRTSGTWGTRIAVDTSSDNPTLIVRAPNDVTYGTPVAGLYWKTTTTETYFYIPEFDTAIVPVLGVLALAMLYRRNHRGKQSTNSRRSMAIERCAAPDERAEHCAARRDCHEP